MDYKAQNDLILKPNCTWNIQIPLLSFHYKAKNEFILKPCSKYDVGKGVVYYG